MADIPGVPKITVPGAVDFTVHTENYNKQFNAFQDALKEADTRLKPSYNAVIEATRAVDDTLTRESKIVNDANTKVIEALALPGAIRNIVGIFDSDYNVQKQAAIAQSAQTRMEQSTQRLNVVRNKAADTAQQVTFDIANAGRSLEAAKARFDIDATLVNLGESRARLDMAYSTFLQQTALNDDAIMRQQLHRLSLSELDAMSKEGGSEKYPVGAINEVIRAKQAVIIGLEQAKLQLENGKFEFGNKLKLDALSKMPVEELYNYLNQAQNSKTNRIALPNGVTVTTRELTSAYNTAVTQQGELINAAIDKSQAVGAVSDAQEQVRNLSERLSKSNMSLSDSTMNIFQDMNTKLAVLNNPEAIKGNAGFREAALKAGKEAVKTINEKIDEELKNVDDKLRPAYKQFLTTGEFTPDQSLTVLGMSLNDTSGVSGSSWADSTMEFFNSKNLDSLHMNYNFNRQITDADGNVNLSVLMQGKGKSFDEKQLASTTLAENREALLDNVNAGIISFTLKNAIRQLSAGDINKEFWASVYGPRGWASSISNANGDIDIGLFMEAMYDRDRAQAKAGVLEDQNNNVTDQLLTLLSNSQFTQYAAQGLESQTTMEQQALISNLLPNRNYGRSIAQFATQLRGMARKADTETQQLEQQSQELYGTSLDAVRQTTTGRIPANKQLPQQDNKYITDFVNAVGNVTPLQ